MKCMIRPSGLGRGILAVVAMLILGGAAPALAQEAPTRDKLQLGPHTFVPSRTVRDPFVLTHFRNSLGVGQAFDVEIPTIEIDSGVVLGLVGDLLVATLDFEYQQAVNRWLAVTGTVQALGRLGTGVQSLLTQGVTAGAGFDIGGLVRLYESDRVYLSGRANFSHGKATVIDLLDFVQGTIDSGKVTDAHPLVDNTSITSGGAGASAAWAVSRLFGLTAEAGGGAGKSSKADAESRGFYILGAAASFDLRAVDFIPVGVSTGFSQTTLPRGGGDISDISRTVFLSIGYNGRPDYFLGIEMTTGWLPALLTDQTIRTSSFQVTSKYMF